MRLQEETEKDDNFKFSPKIIISNIIDLIFTLHNHVGGFDAIAMH